MIRCLLCVTMIFLAAPAVAQDLPPPAAVESDWVSSVREEAGELFVTGFAPEGTRVLIVIGADQYGGETRADADGTWSLTTPIRSDADVAVVRGDTGARQVVARAAGWSTQSSPVVKRIEFSVDPTSSPREGDVITGTAAPGEQIVVTGDEGEALAKTRADEIGRWQVLLPAVNATHVDIAPSSAPEESVRRALANERARLVIDAPELIIQPQSVAVITEPKKQVSVHLDGRKLGTATADRDGYVMVKMNDREPGTFELEAVVDEGTVREVRAAKRVRILNRVRASALPQIGAYLVGGAAGALVGGFVGYGLDGFSFEPKSDAGPPLSQVGIAVGSALAAPLAVHWVSRRQELYQNLLMGLAGSAVAVGGYYAFLPFLRGPASWYGSMFVAGVVAPTTSLLAYNLSPSPRRHLRKQFQANVAVQILPNAVYVRARW